MIADPDFCGSYETAKKHIENKTPQDITGNKHFWRSDYTSHHRPAYFTSLKMCSERTVGIELNMNSENKLGYWLPYGLTYIYRRGDEYTAIFPVWDWALLPGVTSPHVEVKDYDKSESRTQQTVFVGGVSDGQYGVSAMDFSKRGTKAKKAWFWFDKEWVALGAGIASIHEASIVTGINQCLLNGKVMIDGKQMKRGSQKLKNPLWILHDSVGYIFPTDEPVHIKAGIQQGNIQRIYGLGKDTVYSHKVFSLWFDHGVKPDNKTYQYIVVPGTNSKDLGKYAKKLPITVLSNTSKIQAISYDNLGITGIVFHQAGEFGIAKGLIVSVDHPCLVLLNEGEITVCDPTALLADITITLRDDGNVQTKRVDLPTGGFAGKNVSVKLDMVNDKK
jgi:chondroitin AC lyase